jgi:hypothetical protein
MIGTCDSRPSRRKSALLGAWRCEPVWAVHLVATLAGQTNGSSTAAWRATRSEASGESLSRVTVIHVGSSAGRGCFVSPKPPLSDVGSGPVICTTESTGQLNGLGAHVLLSCIIRRTPADGPPRDRSLTSRHMSACRRTFFTGIRSAPASPAPADNAPSHQVQSWGRNAVLLRVSPQPGRRSWAEVRRMASFVPGFACKHQSYIPS